MFTLRSRLPLILPLVVASASLCAQPAPTEATEAPPPAQASQPEKATPPETPPAAKREESPFDYSASEEISEDLPVSFPVDI